MSRASLLIVVILGLASASCGKTVREAVSPQLNPADTACKPLQAIVAVRDGSLQSLCGCAEGPQLVHANSGTLTCTVPVNTVMYFYFVAILQQHMIMPTGTPRFAASVPVAPSGIMTPSHAVTLTTTGTYTFEDGFNSGMRGTIIVQ